MSEKRKISGRKIIQATLTLVLAGVCITAVLSATRMQKERVLSGLDIQITNGEHKFINKNEVRGLLLDNGNIKLNETNLSELNVQQMELDVVSNTWIEDAQVYVDNKHTLHALVTQRVPVVRIFDKADNSYYLDKRGDELELSPKYNCYTTVVTNVPDLKNNTAAEKAMKAQIMTLANYIRKDTFWCRQVSQVIVRDDMKFEIVPVLGNQQIIIGDTTELKTKFDNLFAFYTKVLNRIGWDKYEVLDLSYKGQIVASPAVNWRLPVDNVINRINWVNSILGEGQKNNTTAVARATPPVVATATAGVSAAPVEALKLEPAKEPVVAKEKIIEQTAPAKPTHTEPKPKPAQVEKKPKAVKTKEVIKERKQQEDKPKYIYGGN